MELINRWLCAESSGFKIVNVAVKLLNLPVWWHLIFNLSKFGQNFEDHYYPNNFLNIRWIRRFSCSF